MSGVAPLVPGGPGTAVEGSGVAAPGSYLEVPIEMLEAAPDNIREDVGDVALAEQQARRDAA